MLHFRTKVSFSYLQNNKTLKQTSEESPSYLGFSYLQNNKTLKRQAPCDGDHLSFSYLQNNKTLKLVKVFG